jgi:hypothetical protein
MTQLVRVMASGSPLAARRPKGRPPRPPDHRSAIGADGADVYESEPSRAYDARRQPGSATTRVIRGGRSAVQNKIIVLIRTSAMSVKPRRRASDGPFRPFAQLLTHGAPLGGPLPTRDSRCSPQVPGDNRRSSAANNGSPNRQRLRLLIADTRATVAVTPRSRAVRVRRSLVCGHVDDPAALRDRLGPYPGRLTEMRAKAV